MYFAIFIQQWEAGVHNLPERREVLHGCRKNFISKSALPGTAGSRQYMQTGGWLFF